MKAFTVVGIVLVGLLVCAADIVFGGYVLSCLWSWFVSPLFGLPPISVGAAVGLSTIAGWLKLGLSREKVEGAKTPLEAGVIKATMVFANEAIILAAGWVIFKIVS